MAPKVELVRVWVDRAEPSARLMARGHVNDHPVDVCLLREGATDADGAMITKRSLIDACQALRGRIKGMRSEVTR